MSDLSPPTQEQLIEARRRAAKRFGPGSIPYRATLNGHFDSGNLVRDKLTEVMNESLGNADPKN